VPIKLRLYRASNINAGAPCEASEHHAGSPKNARAFLSPKNRSFLGLPLLWPPVGHNSYMDRRLLEEPWITTDLRPNTEPAKKVISIPNF